MYMLTLLNAMCNFYHTQTLKMINGKINGNELYYIFITWNQQ